MIAHKNFVANLRQDGVLHYQFKAETMLEKADFEQSVQAYQELGKGQLLKVLAEFPEFSDVSNEAREYLQEREIPAIAEAVVFKGLAQRLIFNFYKYFRKPVYPIKGFNSIEAAENWLNTY